MPVRFNPTGNLDIASDPADLPSQSDGKLEVSGAMQRCTNLHLDRAGIACTRRGSQTLNVAGIETDIHRIIEQAGVRYSFAGTQIYKDEVSIETGMADDPWTAILYNSYATTVQSVFALNGTNRKRITGSDVQEWGSESPTVAPTLAIGSGTGLTGIYNAKYTWARLEGTTVVWESNPSPAGTAVTLAGQSLRITATLPTDAQITHLRFYRTLTGGAVYYHDTDVAIADIPVPDTTAYDFSYMYDWEHDYLYLSLSDADFSYCYDWELNYFTGSGYQVLIEDTTNDRIVAYNWELNYNSGIADNVLGYKFLYPWEANTFNARPAATVYQCLSKDIYKGRIICYEWEEDYNAATPTTTVLAYKYTHPWEDNQFNIIFHLDTSTADDSLGSEASWTNHDRPPLGTVVLGPGFNGICFILKDNQLWYSLPNQPEYWPSAYYIEVGTVQYPLRAAAFLAGSLFVANAIEIYSIQGTGPGSFFPLPMSAQTGTLNADCFVPVTGYGIFHLGNDGIYQYAGGKDQLITRGQFEPLFRGETRGNIPGMNRTYVDRCWLEAYHGKLYFGYPGIDSLYPDNILVMDLGTNRTVHHQYPKSFVTAAIDNHNGRLLAGDTEGKIWAWEVLGLDGDDGADIAWQIQSKDFNQYYKYFPRYAKYDVKVNSGMANGYILMDDAVKQTHTITGNRLTRKRLVATCTGDRLSTRLSGSGEVEVYGVEIE